MCVMCGIEFELNIAASSDPIFPFYMFINQIVSIDDRLDAKKREEVRNH